MVDNEILSGVGKVLRASYLASKVSDKEVMDIYLRNKKEADAFEFFGLSIFDLIREEARTHNPLLRQKLKLAILEHKKKSRNSNAQNTLSLEKLEFYRKSALGMGLRPAMKALRSLSKNGNNVATICLKLMEIEFANLTAKKNHGKKQIIYERKDELLMDVSDLLYNSDWECGISFETGKNASYIVYVILPDGTQLSWHTNEYRLLYHYDEIDCKWDGIVCATFEKLFRFIHTHFRIGTPLVEYPMPSAA